MKNSRSSILLVRPSTPIATRAVQWDYLASHGQFGCVWKAKLEGKYVAVKIIQVQAKPSWITEKSMYEYNLNHESILRFYDAEKRINETGMVQYWIITEFHEHGSLLDFLRVNILDWDGMLKMMFSMFDGLAFLHVENNKPIIAHRDFKSKNVLVKSNLTCCISDFGSACHFAGVNDKEDIKAQVRIYCSIEFVKISIQYFCLITKHIYNDIFYDIFLHLVQL